MLPQTNKNFLGIDASNIRHGGGITHLSQLLAHTESENLMFDKVYLWAGKSTLNRIPDKEWLIKKNHFLLNGNLISRTLWQIFHLKKSLLAESCSILFVLGGTFFTSYKPVINFHQNLLPFEPKEILRFGFSKKFIKFYLLRIIQSSSLKRSSAIIYLSNFSKKIVENQFNKLPKNKIIYHGIEPRFLHLPKKQNPIVEYNEDKPFKIIYVSSIDYYKHQWNVVEAISILKNEGFPIRLDLYGVANKSPLKKLNKYIDKYDKERNFINYVDEVSFGDIHLTYKNSDLSVFASSCETFGQIVLESMASGLPIACSEMSSMKEIVRDGCVYFNPLDSNEIAKAVRKLLLSVQLRESVSRKAHAYSKEFSWKETSQQTFDYIKEIQQESH